MPAAADLLVRALAEAGVRVLFGLPPVHGLAVHDALGASAIRVIGMRHEQTAALAADGWARATGEVGVVLATTGPGAVDTLGPVAEAWASGTPLLVIASDGGDGVAAMFGPVTKARFRVTEPADVGRATAESVAAAFTAPPRPVLLEVSADVLETAVGGDEPTAAGGAAYAETPDVDSALPLLLAAERPLLWAGGGALRAGAGPAVAALAERLGAPVLESLGARGLLAGNPYLLGLPPHFPEAVELVERADLVIAVGGDLDGWDTVDQRLSQSSRLVAVDVGDIDGTTGPRADAVVVADAVVGCEELLEGLDDAGHLPPGRGYASPACELPGFAAAWYGDLPGRRAGALRRLRARHPEELAFLDQIARVVPPATTIVVDMGVAGSWLAALHAVPAPRRLQSPTRRGAFGHAVPAAIGAAAAGTPALAICAVDGFLCACGELATVRHEELPFTLVVMDDGDDDPLRRDHERGGTPVAGVPPRTPDHVALATAFGLRAEAVVGLGEAFGVALERHLADLRPSVLVARAALAPLPSIPPRPASDA